MRDAQQRTTRMLASSAHLLLSPVAAWTHVSPLLLLLGGLGVCVLADWLIPGSAAASEQLRPFEQAGLQLQLAAQSMCVSCVPLGVPTHRHHTVVYKGSSAPVNCA
jgi:hypothetical protein